MAKADVRESLRDAAKIYKEALCGKNHLFIYRDGERYEAVELFCRESNFAHLLGVETELPKTQFFERCHKGSLAANDYQIRNMHGFRKKEYALTQFCKSMGNQMTIGRYNNNRVHIEGDYVIGTVNCGLVMGENADGRHVPIAIACYPKSMLQDSTEALTDRPKRVLVSLTKWAMEKHYSKLTHLAKGFKEAHFRRNGPELYRIAKGAIDGYFNR